MSITFNVADTIQALAALVAAIFAGLAYLKANKAASISAKNGVDIAEVKHLTNSLSEKAQALSLRAGLAEGDQLGRAAQTEERRVERVDRATDAAARATVSAANVTVKAAEKTVATVSDPAALDVAERTVEAAEETLDRAKAIKP